MKVFHTRISLNHIELVTCMFIFVEKRLQTRKQFIQEFVKNDGTLGDRRKLKCDTTSLAVTKALENMAKAGVGINIQEDRTNDIGIRRQCFGREICLRMIEGRKNKIVRGTLQNTGYQRLVHEFETIFLLYNQLNDHSLQFNEFLENIKYNEEPNNPISCFDMFPHCY